MRSLDQLSKPKKTLSPLPPPNQQGKKKQRKNLREEEDEEDEEEAEEEEEELPRRRLCRLYLDLASCSWPPPPFLCVAFPPLLPC